MLKNAKILRWLVPVILLILFFILLLAVNYTATASTPDLHVVATAVSEVNQTATVQVKNQELSPIEKPTKKPTPTPTMKEFISPTLVPTQKQFILPTLVPSEDPTPISTPTPTRHHTKAARG